MADFCTVCVVEIGFDTPDIDIKKEFDSLEKDYYCSCICEGCGLKGIAKTAEGNLLLAGMNSGNEWITKEEYFGDKHTLLNI